MKTKFRYMVWAAAIFAVFLYPATVKAAKQANTKTAALNAYAKFLSSDTRIVDEGSPHSYGYEIPECSFGLAYIDNDNIPELVLRYPVNAFDPVWLYTYRNGKVKKIMDGWTTSFYYYEKKGVFVLDSVMYEEEGFSNAECYQLSGGMVHLKLCKYVEAFEAKCFDFPSGVMKKCSLKSYNKKLKSLAASAKRKKVKTYANTYKNRKKYLK